MGFDTSASGYSSTAMGYGASAQDYGTISIGLPSTDTKDQPPTHDLHYQNTAFVIGNGGFDRNGGHVGTDESAQTPSKFYLTAQPTYCGCNVTAPAFIGDGSCSLLICLWFQESITEGGNTRR